MRIPSNLRTRLDAELAALFLDVRFSALGEIKKRPFTGRLDKEAIGKEGVSQERRSKAMSSRLKPARSNRRRRKAWERVEVIA
jgi:hypothetical protein